jgi:ubiquitin carboxyl-terminal hydrolase 9/24
MNNIQALIPKKWLNTEILLEWLDKNRIFDLVFGDSLHSEVIKKSYNLLEFMYLNGKLKKREFDKMWECATKKHEAYKIAILKALAFLATKANLEDLKYLFAKVKSTAMPEIDKFCLDLIKAISKKLVGDVSLPHQESNQ